MSKSLLVGGVIADEFSKFSFLFGVKKGKFAADVKLPVEAANQLSAPFFLDREVVEGKNRVADENTEP